MSTFSGWNDNSLIGESAVAAYLPVHCSCFFETKNKSLDNKLWREDAIRKQLQDIGMLEDDWDGYGGACIEPDAVSKALSLLEYFPEYPHYLLPSSSGTLLLEWEDLCGKSSLELGRERFGFYTAPKKGRPIFLSGNISEMNSEDINDAISTIVGQHKPQATLEVRYLVSG